MNIKTFDLNLLRVFAAVHAKRSVSRAAQALGLSQPALSNALLRLRRLCNDPLFVRTHSGMEPTALAQQLVAPVEQALALLQGAFEQRASFDPARAQRSFRLLTSDAGETAVLPALMEMLERQAPGIGIEAVQMPHTQYAAALQDGKADLAIGNLPFLEAGFYQQRLFADPYCCIVRRSRKAPPDRIDLETYLAAGHIGVASGNADALVERELARGRRRRRVALKVTHYHMATKVVAATSLIATVPRNAVTGAKGLCVLPLPFELAPAEVRQFWHRRAHQDPANQWLRSVISSLPLTRG